MMNRSSFFRAVLAPALCVPLCLFLSVGVRAEPETAPEPEDGGEAVEIVEVSPAEQQDIPDYGALLPADDPAGYRTTQPVESFDVDPHTGDAYPTETEGETDEFYPLSPGVFGYDKLERSYTNYVGPRTFSTSVPNGAILSAGTQVSIELPVGLSGILYRNGDIVTDPDLSEIEGIGSYLLTVQGAQNTESVRFSFRILDDITNNLSEISLPQGFRFDHILLNGEEFWPDYSNYYEFPVDGSYQISWSCEAIGQQYLLTFVRDTQIPELTVEGLTKELPHGEAHGPVTLSWEDENAYVVVRHADGSEHRIASSPTELASSGEYTVTIWDTAGNNASYDFIIHVYLNLSAYAAIALVLLGVAFLIAYSRRVKKHSRVG